MSQSKQIFTVMSANSKQDTFTRRVEYLLLHEDLGAASGRSARIEQRQHVRPGTLEDFVFGRKPGRPPSPPPV